MDTLKPDLMQQVAEEVTPLADDLHPTDAGNARRFARQHAATLKFCPDLNCWLAWDDKRWRVDSGTGVMQRAKATALALYAEASQCCDSGKRRDLADNARNLESASRLEAMIRLARSEPELVSHAAAFDADPLLLNVANGVVDLRKGILRPHDSAFMITRLSDVTYDPTVRCPAFEAFLHRVLGGNVDLIQFLQRALGYTLTGLTSEQCLFVLHGQGANGKSTLIEVVRQLMGDYARQAPFAMLLSKAAASGIGPQPEIVRLRGARFVTAVEADPGGKLAEAVVKQLTGQDVVTGRGLHQDFIEFTPQFKLWLAANHKPQVRGRDEGIWRRIKLVPFSVTIPEAERDRQLSEKLAAELPGILAWAVRGCIAWQHDGLCVPAVVQQATAAYRDETDELGEFIDECLVEDPTAFVASKVLTERFGRWAISRGVPPMSATQFGELFGLRPKVTRDRKSGKRGFLGYRIGR